MPHLLYQNASMIYIWNSREFLEIKESVNATKRYITCGIISRETGLLRTQIEEKNAI